MKIVSAGLVLALLISLSPAALAEGTLSPEKRQVIAEVDALEAQIVDMSMELWNFSEIAKWNLLITGFGIGAVRI